MKITIWLITAMMLTALASGTTARADEPRHAAVNSGDSPLTRAEAVDEPSPTRKVYRGRYHTIIEGDTVLMVVFNDITVYPPMRFKNKKQEQFYRRTVRDVRKTLPWAKMICETLVETYEYLQTFDSADERDRYIKEMESEVFAQYKPQLMKFAKSQAKMLVKLIRRETDQSGYDILKAFLGSVRATFWHGFGRIFGVNIKGDYRPETDENDAIIERVATLVEQGSL